MSEKPQACIFDLDGVIVDTARYHFSAWSELANELVIPFNEEDNEQLKGLSRIDSLEFILRKGSLVLDNHTKVRLMDRKNDRYLSHVKTMTPAELHKMADTNSDGEVSYVEYATAIYRSPKHGPIGFGKSDRNKSGTLNLKEFESRLKGIKWYRISRKTPAQWHAEFDANSDGALNKEEFIAFLGSTAHIETFLKRADKDKSGGISVEELADFIKTILKE